MARVETPGLMSAAFRSLLQASEDRCASPSIKVRGARSSRAALPDHVLAGLKPEQIAALVRESHHLIDQRLNDDGTLPATADDRTDTLPGQTTVVSPEQAKTLAPNAALGPRR